MITSSDKTPKIPPPKKLKKPKGPIRWGAILPLAILMGAVVAYFVLFFDLHFKKGIEYVGTLVNQAKVDVGSLKTSFLKGDFRLKKLEITNKAEPMENIVEIGDIHFQFSWDALLRAKVYIKDASVTDIKSGTERRYSGAVPLPPEKPKKKSVWQIAMEQELEKAKNAFGSVDLSNLTNILHDFNPEAKLQAFKDNLQARKLIESLDGEFAQKKSEWESRLGQVPKAEDFAALKSQVASIDPGQFQDPVQVVQAIQTAQSVAGQIRQKATSVEQLGSGLVNDVTQFAAFPGRVTEAINQDIQLLKDQLKLPSLDVEDLSAQLFGQDFMNWVALIQSNVVRSRELMIAQQDQIEQLQEKVMTRVDQAQEIHQKYFKKEKPTIVPHVRGTGQNFVFGRPNSYPPFWLRQSVVSSTATDDFSANLEGRLEHITSSPKMVGKPMTIALKGDFPKKRLNDLVVQAVLDHTQDVPRESFELSVGGFTIAEKALSVGDTFKLGLSQARVGMKLTGHFEGFLMDIQLKNGFRETGFMVEAQPPVVQDSLRSVLGNIHEIDLSARAHGTWQDVEWEFSSNLAEAIKRGLEALLFEKLQLAQQKIQRFVEEQIAEKRKLLEDKVNGYKGELLGKVTLFKGEAQAAEKLVQDKVAMLEGKKRELEDRVRKEAEAKLQEEKRKAEQKAGEEIKKLVPKLF
jgi:uncharacterized protein (TIGR03545 family)